MTFDISILVPLFNEEENVSYLTGELLRFVQSYPSLTFEVVFIDDGSTDRTVNALAQSCAQWPLPSSIIRLSKNFGSHAALRAGILHASGRRITFMYADLQDPLELIGQMLERSQAGYDIVWGVRRTYNPGVFEKCFSTLYHGLMTRYVSRRYPKKGVDMVLFTRKVADWVNRNPEANSSLFLQIMTLGFRQCFVEYDKQKRRYGTSKWTLSKKIKLFIDSFVAFSYAPIRMVSLMGILFLFGGLLWSLYMVLRELLAGDLPSGWPTLMAVLLLGLGVTNIGMGILAEYLWRTLDAVRGRPVFIIEDIRIFPVTEQPPSPVE